MLAKKNENWLARILADVDRRAKKRPPWAISDYARDEIDKLKASK